MNFTYLYTSSKESWNNKCKKNDNWDLNLFDLLIHCVGITTEEFEPEKNKLMEWWLDVPFFILKSIKNIKQVRLSFPKHQISATTKNTFW